MKHVSFQKFVKQETVLCAAMMLAVLSCFFVRPDKEYAKYLDFRTLALLFSLMAVMAGLREQGVFFQLGKILLSKASGIRQIMLVLVLLCFFGSMIITNDVALITFVPFAFVVLDLFGPEVRKAWVLPVVCMQTIAANLGSMFTPIGNPQNLYLYGKSGLSLSAFWGLMLPYTLAALLLLVGWILFLCRKNEHTEKTSVSLAMQKGGEHNTRKIFLYGILFLLCLLTVAHVLPYQALLCAVLAALLCFDHTTLGKVDYSLLLTFIGFFVFIGNLGRMDAFSGWLRAVLSGRETIVAVLASQVISNVPAALLLSGFTDRTAALIIGTNLGGLGTLIASMASLISFRQVSNGEPARKGEYFLLFTLSNVAFLSLLLGVWGILSAI
jgi:Na+/H+ antiporter NhaD/arsenite permease-like protein